MRVKNLIDYHSWVIDIRSMSWTDFYPLYPEVIKPKPKNFLIFLKFLFHFFLFQKIKSSASFARAILVTKCRWQVLDTKYFRFYHLYHQYPTTFDIRIWKSLPKISSSGFGHQHIQIVTKITRAIKWSTSCTMTWNITLISHF